MSINLNARDIDAAAAALAKIAFAELAQDHGISVNNLYHAMVEALIHPYNTDALDAVRNLVGGARRARAAGEVPANEEIKQLVLDAEAVLDHLGVAPLEITDEDNEKAKAMKANIEQAAREFLLRTVAEAEAEHAKVHPDHAGEGLPN